MALQEAIQAAQAAGQTTAEDIFAWLESSDGTKASNGRKLGLVELADVLGPVRAGQILASIKQAAASDTTYALVVTILSTGGSIKPGDAAVQGVLDGMVTATIISSDERDDLVAMGQRDRRRAEVYGLGRTPQPYEIHKALA